jgi:hypothetical protein
MPTVDTSAIRPNAQRHGEVALSLAQGLKTNLTVPPLKATAIPSQPVNWTDLAEDWLDTPADHCSPLDDY